MVKSLLPFCAALLFVLPARAVTYLELHRGKNMIKSYFPGDEIMLKDHSGIVSGMITGMGSHYILVGERTVYIREIRKIYVPRHTFKYAGQMVIAGAGYSLINLINSALGYQRDGRVIEPRTAYISGALVLGGLYFLRHQYRRYTIGGRLRVSLEDYTVR